MKRKLLVFSALLFVSVASMGQVDSLLTDKKGNLILPQKGDYAIGISTNSIFNYLGNMFNNHSSNSLHLSLLNGTTLYGKYFTSAETAIRAKVLFNGNFSESQSPFTNSWNQTEYYTLIRSSYDINISLGYEKRKGSGRLQFSYGPEFSIGTFLDKTEGSEYHPDRKYITPLKLGARVFGGAEYFFMPNISIGGEIGFGIYGDFLGKAHLETNGGYNETVKMKNSSWSIGPDIMGGQIILLIHF